MLLTVDIGNTKTELGLWEDQRLVARVRAPTHGGSDWLKTTRALVEEPKCGGLGGISGIAVASVVPTAIEAWALVATWFNVPFCAFDGTNVPGMPVALPRPEAVGPDRVINALGALEWGGAPVIAVDLGTATTFDVVDAEGVFRGGAIVAGAGTALDSLVARTARLPPVLLEAPVSVIGTDTVSAMQSGAVFGYAALVDGLVARIRTELGVHAPCIATGGLAARFAPHCASFDRVDDALTLRGLRRAWELST